MLSRPLEAAARCIEYPTSDGAPIGGTDDHFQQIIELIHQLEQHFKRKRMVYVSGALLLFYEEGNPRKHCSPDVLVTFGVPKKRRRRYLVWEEGKAPDFVVEVTSERKRYEDTVLKKRLYARLGVREYFLFDPHHEHLPQQLCGYRLVNGRYEPMEGKHLRSEVLGLELRVVRRVLRLYNPQTRELLPTRAQLLSAWDRAERIAERNRKARAKVAERIRKATERIRKATERIRKAEAKAAELQAQIDALKGKPRR